MSAWVTGFSGLALALWIGTSVLGLELRAVLLAVLGSNLGGFFGGSLTLWAERQPGLKANVLRGGMGTWGCLAFLYFGILLGIAPAMRELHVFVWLVLPIIMSSGLMLNWAFGPLQDWVFRRGQLRDTQMHHPP